MNRDMKNLRISETEAWLNVFPEGWFICPLSLFSSLHPTVFRTSFISYHFLLLISIDLFLQSYAHMPLNFFLIFFFVCRISLCLLAFLQPLYLFFVWVSEMWKKGTWIPVRLHDAWPSMKSYTAAIIFHRASKR